MNHLRYGYGVGGFKSFADSSKLNIAPITIFCGPNSSGKSSLIQSLLLLRQSIPEQQFSGFQPRARQPLLLNGPLTQLGSWLDAVHMKGRSTILTFNLKAEGHYADFNKLRSTRYRIHERYFEEEGPYSCAIMLRFGSKSRRRIEISQYLHSATFTLNNSELEIEQLQATDRPQYRIKFTDLASIMHKNNRRYYNPANEDLVALLEYVPRMPKRQWSVGPFDVESYGPFPVINRRNTLWREFCSQYYKALLDIRRGTRGPTPRYLNALEAEINNATEDASGEPAGRDAGDLASEYPICLALTGCIERCLDSIIQEATNLVEPLYSWTRYLGPLRDEPKRYYQFDDTGGLDIGVKGQYAIQVLALERHRTISYVPISSSDRAPIAFAEAKTETLEKALQHWLSWMGLPSVATEVIRHSMYSTQVDDRGLRVSLPDVGFGVSQVVPLVLEALRASPGETLLIEQPEIHLHPKIQSLLADFFLSRAESGIRFIIESHSEYMIKRLCRRLAEGSTDQKGKISIYFVTKSGHESAASEIEFTPHGEILNWPVGFFDTSEDTLWMQASLTSRKASLG